MKIQCENCCSYNTVDENPNDEAFECWNCKQCSFISIHALFNYMLRTGKGEVEAYQDLYKNLPKTIDGYM